ncbi:PadR family transcriptional regulator [Helicovermis profundi]|uniref:PadR family transcriptional regulator n=1 Tax=Helicovermis profundi TaxID=3065157 RepID=A0AAU9E9D8_9FIRM|nr:PadR family transcriptional regulator [Clostridia bacterium S502]
MNRELLKGTTEVMILKMIETEPMYGYGMIKNFEIMSKGTFKFKEGTLYPILHSLEKKKYIESFWNVVEGRKRKYYRITTLGTRQLEEKENEWLVFSKALNEILGC